MKSNRTPWRSSYTRMDNVIQCLLLGSFWLSIWLDFSCRCQAIAAANQRAAFTQFPLYHSITHERERGKYGLLKGSQKLVASSIIKGIKLYLHWTDSCVSVWVCVCVPCSCSEITVITLERRVVCLWGSVQLFSSQVYTNIVYDIKRTLFCCVLQIKSSPFILCLSVQCYFTIIYNDF